MMISYLSFFKSEVMYLKILILKKFTFIMLEFKDEDIKNVLLYFKCTNF